MEIDSAFRMDSLSRVISQIELAQKLTNVHTSQAYQDFNQSTGRAIHTEPSSSVISPQSNLHQSHKRLSFLLKSGEKLATITDTVEYQKETKPALIEAPSDTYYLRLSEDDMALVVDALHE